MSAWAEQGIAPPRSTRYEVTDSQVSVPANAAARRGIQPVVDLTVRGPGDDRVDVAAGQSVTFRARIQVPPRTGQVVAIDWDFTGTGNFVAGVVRAAEADGARAGHLHLHHARHLLRGAARHLTTRR